jgi:hypothetical protein
VEPQTSSVCSTSFIRSLLTDVTDELVTECDYHTDEESASSPSNAISASKRPRVAEAQNAAITEEDIEEDEDGFKVQDFTLNDSPECSDGNEELDDCEFDDDVCSTGSDDVGDVLVADQFAKNAISDDVIQAAFEETNELDANWLLTADSDAIDENGEVDFLDESTLCGDEVAFDFASTILDGAFKQAATSWQDVSAPRLDPRDGASESCQADGASPAIASNEVEDIKETELSPLKQKAREALLKVARAKLPSQKEDTEDMLKSKVQKALFAGVKNGDLSKALGQAMPQSGKVAEKKTSEVSLEQKVRQALSKGVATGELSKGLEKAMQQDAWNALRSKVHNSLRVATTSGSLTSALGQAMRKTQPWECLREKVQKSLIQSVDAGNLQQVVMRAVGANLTPEAATLSVPRPLSSTRSRRRIIGGVVRAPAIQDMVSPSASSPSKLSKPRSRLHEASMSAMAMDLGAPRSATPPAEEHFSGSQAWNRQTMSRNGVRASFQIPFPASDHGFAPAPLTSKKKMHSSASLGSLTPLKVCKATSGGFLPTLAPERISAETIAWSMQVSKTTSKWSNTGLRGSKSMVF